MSLVGPGVSGEADACIYIYKYIQAGMCFRENIEQMYYTDVRMQQ
jgi:hypothetical protein